MKKIFQIIVLAIGFSHLSLGAFEIDKEKYLFGTLKDPKYVSLWNSLFENEENVDDWLKNYAEWQDGPSSPGEDVIIDGRKYLIRNVCEAHNCGSNYFVVAFSADAKDVLGLQMRMKYVRDFDVEQNKFVRKRVIYKRFFGSGKNDSSDHIVSLKSSMVESRTYPKSLKK